MLHSNRSLVVALLVLVATAVSAHAQVADHLKCYKIKDALNLAAVVDLNSPQFGLEPGCKVSKAKFFCVPVTKTVVSAEDKGTHVPITPLPVGGPDPGDRVCYKVKCPVNPPLPPPDTLATDQFGTRVFTHFKASLLCTPAVKGPYQRFVDNGDGTVTDRQTGLQWEQKVAGAGCLHCVDDSYLWRDAMSSFISRVNGFTESIYTQDGLAGHNDWRMPNVIELRTIFQPSPCCIDPSFGPTEASRYFSSSTETANTNFAWGVNFGAANVSAGDKDSPFFVRAVRGGF